MNKTTKMIRQEMEETKVRLAARLESLEHQASVAVQSAGTAVNATVGAVQAVVQSISHALDVRHHIDRHPWVVLGGSLVLGYFAAEYLAESAKKPEEPPEIIPSASPSAETAAPRPAKPDVSSVATEAALTAPYESGRENSSWQQLRGIAIGACIGIVQDLASRAVPKVMDYLAGNRGSDSTNRSESPVSTAGFPRETDFSQLTRCRFTPSSDHVNSGMSS